MSVIAPPAPARPAPAPAPGPISNPGRRRWRVMLLGVSFLVLLAAIVVVIFESFSGSFSTFAVVQAQLPASSTGLALNAPVEYRHVTVGKVASQGRSIPGGLVLVTLHMTQSMLSSIPAGVRATETPVSFFGDAYLVLQPPQHIGTATLSPGAIVPALLTGPTASLQSTLGDLDSLLIALHPAQLDAALTALAGAIQGQGASLGHNLVRGNAYFSQMLPLWPTVVADLRRLVPVSNQFALSSQDILAILSNQTTTGQTINSQATAVRQALGGGADVSRRLSQLLSAIQQPYAILAADSGPFLKDISQNPKEISELLQGFDAWAKAWSAAESSGPYLRLTANVVVANPADLGLAVLGGPQMAGYLAGGLGPGYVNPPTYTSAGSVPGNAAVAREAALALAKVVTSAPAPVMSAPAELSAVSQVVAALGGRRPESPAVSSLLLSPVLESLVAAR